MTDPKVSIIIPTYNVEKYLQQCLDSLSKQTYGNFEVIIIIDGATDHSYDIAKRHCEKDDRFKVFWQENAGSGPARNHGLEKATGELIMFVDPDDWCDNDYVKSLVRIQQQGDYDLVTTCWLSIYFGKNGKIKKTEKKSFEEEQIKGLRSVRENYLKLYKAGAVGGPHCKMYKASIINQYGVRFPDLRRSQDIVFNYRYYNYVSSVCVSNYSGYMYRVLIKARANRIKVDYYKTIELIYNDIIELYKKWNIPVDDHILSTEMYDMVYSYCESCINRNENIVPAISNVTIQHILQNARPTKWHLKKVRKYLLAGNYSLASIVIRFAFFAKNLLM